MRLIDADEIRWVEHHDAHGNLSSYKIAFSDEMPPVIEERKTGRWILVNDNNGQHFVCEFCGEWRYHTQQKYCGECGAKLSLKVEHEDDYDYERASDMRDYCGHYEPTYNPEDGSM